MSALDKFIKTENKWANLYSGEILTCPTTAKECELFFQKLEGELSPENLHCDGEISDAEAKKKCDHFLAVWKELEEITGNKRQLFSVWV